MHEFIGCRNHAVCNIQNRTIPVAQLTNCQSVVPIALVAAKVCLKE
jgi:hypothetical protein